MNIAIIAAAGAGTRMASDRPKQFLLLAGTPVIIHTLKVFDECESIHEVIVVLPAAESAGFLSLAGKFGLRKVARVVPGGVTRADSVKRGLLAIGGLAAGFTFGIMLALLQGGLVRMQHNPATKDKLDLLKRSLWSGSRKARAKVKANQVGEEEEEEVRSLRHARPEATGSGF